MNVLIIDDQPDVVAGIHSGINWDALSIRQVFCANDIIRAREILSNNSVDIMLCDIEMPLGSGLELYEWVAEHFPEIKCIFLTSHEDFSYAQKALQLGGFDYLIQPAPYSAIEVSIQKAVLQIQKEKKEKFYSEYGNYFSKREMDLLDVLLNEFLQKQPAEPQNILSFLDTISIKCAPLSVIKIYCNTYLYIDNYTNKFPLCKYKKVCYNIVYNPPRCIYEIRF